MNTILEEWAGIWGVPPEALEDLAARVTIGAAPSPDTAVTAESEAYTQSLVRLAAPGAGLVLWRNNVGALPNPDTGRPVRFGLANDTKQLNESIKSGDLIGWKTEVITPEMVGQTFARFISIECKEIGWQFGQVPPDSKQGLREHAQRRWAEMVNAAGGLASFSTGGIPF